jgi:hypothetical protein
MTATIRRRWRFVIGGNRNPDAGSALDSHGNLKPYLDTISECLASITEFMATLLEDEARVINCGG